jgi:RNA 3'-terminal phosphate cyclase (ATP)
VAAPAFTSFGANFSTELIIWGWMTAGNGQVELAVEPVRELRAVSFKPKKQAPNQGVAGVTNLPSHIPHRMARRAHNLLTRSGLQANIRSLRERGKGPGAGIVLWRPQAGFSSLGRKGLPADKVAGAAVAELFAFLDNGAAVDTHLADQLLVPMALAQGNSTFSTDRLTRHTLTNVELLRRWLSIHITVTGGIDKPGQVSVQGLGLQQDSKP